MSICELMESAYFSNLSIAIIGAGIGVLGSLYIFRQTIEKDKLKEEQKREDYLASRFKLTTELLKDVLKQSNDQADKYIEQGDKIKENPYNFHYVQLLASNQMARLQNIDSQDLFDAFIDRFGDSDETINKYKDFFGHVDFVSKSLEMTFSSNDRNIKNLGQDQEKLRLLIDTFYSNYFILKNSSETIPEIKVIMDKYWMPFQEYIGSGPVDLQKMNREFFVPLFEEVKKSSADNNVSGAHILVSLRGITTLMHHIAINNTHYAEYTALVLKNNLQKSIAFLEAIAKEIASKPNEVVSREDIDEIVIPVEKDVK